MNFKSAYAQKLRDPRWQKKRLEIMSRDKFTCRSCASTERTLNVHHLFYPKGAEPWECPDESLATLCELCHESEPARRDEELATLAELFRQKFLSTDLLCLRLSIQMLPEVGMQESDAFYPVREFVNAAKKGKAA